MTEAGSVSRVHSSATVRLMYHRFPIRRAGRTSGISRRIFWQFELADPPSLLLTVEEVAELWFGVRGHEKVPAGGQV